jgi:hypothetical protein
VLIGVAFQPAEAIFGVFVFYAASGPAAWLWHRHRKRHDPVTQQ